MFKRLLLILCITASTLSFAGDYIGARIVPLEAENIKISDFEIDEDWEAPVVIVKYEIEKQQMGSKSSSGQDKRRKTIRFKVDRELLTNSQIDLISEESGFFSSRKKQRKLAQSLFTLKATKSLSGRVLLLELK